MSTEPDCAWGLLVFGLLLSAVFAWVTLAHPTAAERQRVLDASCPAVQPVIRYPAEMGGPHPVVCNPTGGVWR